LVHGLLFNSETGLPQGQVSGYPPPAYVPGSHSSPGMMMMMMMIMIIIIIIHVKEIYNSRPF
jgi:hypothetical protein